MAPNDTALTDQAATDGTQPATPYLVLARKYRPRSFADLRGQDALVRTLTNAIDTGRVAHAFILTGVRGVGKTTTARIIARALNCIGPDGNGGPTVTPCGVCTHCKAILEDRHVDVIEIDAASHTGVDNVRSIIDSVQYAPASARFKIYIIDEVHMLSKNAFNALLKTLEEPPPHAKFIFATTEIKKVPVTVLSRCQRFDLRRIDAAVLKDLFKTILGKEGRSADDDALDMISRAADGSARDGLSLLDQAIARADGAVTGESVRAMLGLADRTVLIDLFEKIHKGDAPAAFETLNDLHALGADPLAIVQDLMDLTHFLTKAKAAPETIRNAQLPEAERVKGQAMASALSIPALGRTWQILLKGLQEMHQSPMPQQTMEMIVIRLIFAAELPDPAELVKQVRDGAPATGGGRPLPTMPSGGGAPTTVMHQTSARVIQHPSAAHAPTHTAAVARAPEERTAADGAPMPMPRTFEEMVDMFRIKREILLHSGLFNHARLVSFAPGAVQINLSRNADRNLIGQITQKLQTWTGARWLISVVSDDGGQTMAETARQDAAALMDSVKTHPTVAAVLTAFPGAKITEIREIADAETTDISTDTE